MNNPTGLVPETELNPYSLDAYVTEKVRNQNNINKASILNLGKNAINTKVNINSGDLQKINKISKIGAKLRPPYPLRCEHVRELHYDSLEDGDGASAQVYQYIGIDHPLLRVHGGARSGGERVALWFL